MTKSDRVRSEPLPADPDDFMVNLCLEHENQKAEIDKLKARLSVNKCNSGHTTLTIGLWDCPECVRIAREKLEAENERLKATLHQKHQNVLNGEGIEGLIASAGIEAFNQDELIQSEQDELIELTKGGDAEHCKLKDDLIHVRIDYSGWLTKLTEALETLQSEKEDDCEPTKEKP